MTATTTTNQASLLSRAEVLTRFGWSEEELIAAQSIGFPAPSVTRDLTSGLPSKAEARKWTCLWRANDVEKWERVFIALARKSARRFTEK
jgi:hypothetical protein